MPRIEPAVGPGGFVSAPHIHPRQTGHFAIRRGSLRFRLDDEAQGERRRARLDRRMTMVLSEIATPRTILRPLGPADTPALHALWTAPGVRRHLWDGEVIPPERTAALVARSAALHAERGLGLWGARLAGGDDLIGFAGYWHFHEPPALELGYGVAEAHWGRGYATEIAGALVRYGFDTLGLAEIRASLDAANAASARVLAKLGFLFERRAAGGDLCCYRLPRAGREDGG